MNKFIYGKTDTRKNGEDFALTPYIFLVNCIEGNSKVYGLGICWGYSACFISYGFNVPEGFTSFKKY